MTEREILKATDMSGAAAPVYEKFEKNSRIDKSGITNKEAFKEEISAGEKTIVEINSSKRTRIKEIDRQDEIKRQCLRMMPKRTLVQESKVSENVNTNDENSRGR